MHKNRQLFIAIGLTLLAIAFITALGPAEKTLGTNVRVVYLHGAWVWAALCAFFGAGAAGAAGLVSGRETINKWSRALGRTGLLFWITYLPLSMWAMQTNWNGLFLAEPRWRMAIIFAVCGLLIQIGITLLEDPIWASAANLVYLIALGFAVYNVQDVMHPSSPIMDSDAASIQIFFFGLLLLALLLVGLIAKVFRNVEDH